MLDTYTRDAQERENAGMPPLPLTADQTAELTHLLEGNPANGADLLALLKDRVAPGVTDSAQIKAAWLKLIALGEATADAVAPTKAIEMLGQMGGGYNVQVLVELLEEEELADSAAEALTSLVMIYESFDKVADLAKGGNVAAQSVLKSWAKAEWFTNSPELPETLTLTIYKVDGETNTDDFSPASEAWSRADIPQHAKAFGTKRFPGGIEAISAARMKGNQVAFAGDVVGTGSSRKSAINSMAWHIGDDIPQVPNKRSGGVVIGGIIAPIFYATARDAGVLPIVADVTMFSSDDEVVLHIADWTLASVSGQAVEMQPRPATLLDEFRAGGRLKLIIGRQLTAQACAALDCDAPTIFAEVENPVPAVGQAYTLAQKMVGKACGVEGILPGTSCEPKMTTVGSQDTTGPMTMQEIDELACLRFKADLFMQSFCHTAAYPKKSDFGRWGIMTNTTTKCGGVALKPGDGVIHSWLNRMLIPDTVGTGGDSHTRFPLGISFPAGSGLVAFAGALGFMPLEMPESVLVRFKGKRKPGITVRDMVNAIPHKAIEQGLLTVAKEGKKNIFAGRILEIEGVDDLSADEAFELTDAAAERSAAAATIALPLETVITDVTRNVALLKSMVEDGYQDGECLEKRIAALEEWLADPSLLEADAAADYAATIEIDLSELTEPILACPNDPDDVKLLSEVAGARIDEVFIGSCMTHMDHLRNAARLLEGRGHAKGVLWITPATRMDEATIKEEGGLSVFAQAGARVEIPGCSLCMGNQARVHPGATVLSTSTRNFDNRLGDGAQVYLGSTELSTITSLLGELPTPKAYFEHLK